MARQIDRRTLLKAAAALAAFPLSSVSSIARTHLQHDPFILGVASGSPLANSVVLWTRLMLQAGESRASGKPIEVAWEVAGDEGFKNIVQKGTAKSEPEFADSIHLEVNGLQPEKWYWYRFFLGDATSPVGRTRTSPLPSAKNKQLRFGFASCQRYDSGYYSAHRHMAQEDLDLVFFLGDYIYEAPSAHHVVRATSLPEAQTLEQYRALYELYKTDKDLQLCHANFPWILTWDDHEVSNDYANDQSETLQKNFPQRRAAAYQAYYEHQPLRPSARPINGKARMYQNYDFGGLARFHVLDDRQYRDYQLDPKPNMGGSNMIQRSARLADPKRTLLGWEQEKWLDKSIDSSNAVWDVIAQQTLMAQHVLPDGTVWTDGWDGYPAARQRLLETVAHKGNDTLVIGGDIHSYAAANLKLDFDDPKSKVIAAEVCGTSITSPGPKVESHDETHRINPHIKLLRSDKRGYVTVSLNEKTANIDLRSIENVADPHSNVSTLASFTVEKGKPGLA